MLHKTLHSHENLCAALLSDARRRERLAEDLTFISSQELHTLIEQVFGVRPRATAKLKGTERGGAPGGKSAAWDMLRVASRTAQGHHGHHGGPGGSRSGGGLMTKFRVAGTVAKLGASGSSGVFGAQSRPASVLIKAGPGGPPSGLSALRAHFSVGGQSSAHGGGGGTSEAGGGEQVAELKAMVASLSEGQQRLEAALAAMAAQLAALGARPQAAQGEGDSAAGARQDEREDQAHGQPPQPGLSVAWASSRAMAGRSGGQGPETVPATSPAELPGAVGDGSG